MNADGRGGDGGCRTIGEVAEALRLPQHVLRFWETRFPEVRPIKRAGGRRAYRPEDVVLLRAIRDLLYGEGYTIKGVQRLLRDQGAGAFGAEAAQLPAGEQPAMRPDVADVRALEARLRAVAATLTECRQILNSARDADR